MLQEMPQDAAALLEPFEHLADERIPGLPVWRQIETVIRRAIATRRVMPGQRLPTETQFAGFFGVHRHTIRRAIAPLVSDGLVGVRQGQGMTVRDQVIDYPVTARTRFSEIISAQSLSPGGEIVEMVVEPARPDVAMPLSIEPGEPVIRVEMLRWADGVPISIASDYVVRARLPGFMEVMEETRSITRTLTRLGAGDYARARTTVQSRMPTPEEADQLRQAPNQPILCVDAINVVGENRFPIQYTRARFASQRVQLIFDTL